MNGAFKKASTLILAVVVVLSVFALSSTTAHAYIFSLGTVTVSGGGTTATLTDGGSLPLKAGVTYTLNLNYDIPTALQGKGTYIKITLGDGLYYTSLPGATFQAGEINDTSFQSLVKAPDSSPKYYGYPTAGSSRSHTGTIIYKTKSDLTSVANSMINFRVDDAYENEDADQILENAISVSVGSTEDTSDESITSNVNAQDAYGYSFWTTVGSEQIGSDETTDELSTYTYNTASDKSLTKAGTKTTVKITYPSYATLESLEETSVYQKAGTVVNTVTEGENKVSTVEWDEPGSYSGGCTFKPHISVSGNESKKFNVTISDFSKSIINEDTGRTSGGNQAVLTVIYTPTVAPSAKVGGINVLDSMPNWSLKKYTTYNVRLGGYTLRNNGTADSKEKTIEIKPDTGGTAIVRGVTIPWTGDISNYSSVEWEASDGTSGTTAAATAITSPGAYEIKNGQTIYGGTKSGALIKNTSLGLGQDVSITSIKVNIGKIHKGFQIPQGLSDVMHNNTASETTIDNEYYGWSYVACGVYGTWKQGTDSDVLSDLRLYDTGSESDSGIVTTLRAKSSAPEVLNGVGTINKTQVDGGNSFTISGWIDNANWDWNPLQEPVLYVFMPEGFSYEGLTVTNATLSEPEDLGHFTYNEQNVEVYKYTLDIGEETRGVYQPDFTNKAMNVSMTVNTNKRSRVGTYHINDFLGFSTEDFKEIGAVIKSDHWDHSNWDTSKYTEAINSSDISDQVNYGKTMVSLSEGTGVAVKQGYEIKAKSSFSVTSAKTGETREYVYDDSSAETRENTTAIVNKGDTVNLNIDVKNNAQTYLDHCTLFIPLMKKGADFGTGFMPEGANGFDLSLESVTAPDSFEVKYIKFRSSAQYSINEAPQSSDYDIVTDPAEADMVMLVSTSEIADGYGGTVKLTFKAGDDLSAEDVGKRNVITPMLDYDINGNTSTQTKEAAAVAYGEAGDTDTDTDTDTYTPVKSDPPVSKQITGDTPETASEFTFTLTADPASSTLPAAMTTMPMPQGLEPLQTVTTSITGAGSSEFGDITFTQPGTYVYHVTEENTGTKGYTYDDSVYTVKYVITANDETQSLECVRTITKDGVEAEDVIFTNVYKKTDSTTNPDKPDDSVDTDKNGGNNGDEPTIDGGGSSGGDNNNGGANKSANNGGGTTKSKGVRTGDDSGMPVYLFILAVAVCALAAAVRKKE